MKRQSVWRGTRTSAPTARTLPAPEKLSKEGFPSYTRTIEEQVISVLTTGSTANLFYVKAEENIKNLIDVLQKCDDLEFLAKATIYAREKGYTRTLPIASLVEISRRDASTFKQINKRVCLNPHDWQQFIEIARGKLIRKGLGRAVKKEIHKVLSNMSEFHAIKYHKAVEDMINVSRPHPKVNPFIIYYIKNKVHAGEQMQMLEKLKKSQTEEDAIKAIEEGKLPYEVVSGSTKMTPKIWETLLYNAPYFFLIRNLNNFIRNGVFDKKENLNYALSRIKNKKQIANSKLFPFRFYIAYKMLIESNSTKVLRNALEDAIEISTENIPNIEGKVAIASDVSGSMISSLTGDNSVVQCIDIVALFSAILIRKCSEMPILLPFESKVREDLANKMYSKETIMGMASAFHPTGGTSLSAPVEYLINKKIPVDYFIAFTDNEEWVGREFLEAFLDYKENIAPECKAYLVTLLPYGDAPAPPDIKDVHFIYGWSENVIRYITTNPERQLEEVNEIRINE